MYNKRTDRNQQDIVDALRRVGCSIQDLSKVGGGCPDLLISFRGKNILLEVKTDTGRLNALQVDFHATWHGPLYVVKSVNEALKAIGVE
jgi:lambda repressor-like predicted transcriptional regulator